MLVCCGAVRCVGGVHIVNFLRPVKARRSEEDRACGALLGQAGGRCVKWPTAGEVLGGTHLQWGLGRGLEPPHTQTPADGSRGVVMRSGPCGAGLWALREGVCRQAMCVRGEAALTGIKWHTAPQKHSSSRSLHLNPLP